MTEYVFLCCIFYLLLFFYLPNNALTIFYVSVMYIKGHIEVNTIEIYLKADFQ